MSHCKIRVAEILTALLLLFITFDASARSWRGDCAPDSRGGMPSGCLWQPLSTLISDEAHLICTGKLPTPNLINNLFEKAIANSKNKEDRECIKREKLRITELTKLQPQAFENREIQEAIRVAENEEQKKIDLANAVKEREAAREEALSRLGEFTVSGSPVDRCQTIPPPAANDEKFVRSIVGLREGSGPNHLPYPSILENANRCIDDPCTFRCQVIFDSQNDPNSVSLALERLEKIRESEEQRLAEEQAATKQKIAAGLGYTYSVKDFTSGMSKHALEKFARATKGATFLDEGDYRQPYGFLNDYRVPRNFAVVDFNFCGAAPKQASYNASYTSKAESWLSAELHEKCLKDFGAPSNYTIAGLPAVSAEHRVTVGEERFDSGIYNYQCVDINLSTSKIDYEELMSSVGSLEAALTRKYGRSEREKSGSTTRSIWDAGWSDTDPKRYEALQMEWDSYTSGSSVRFSLRDCRYSKVADKPEVNPSDI